MNIHFLIRCLVVSLTISSSVLASDIPPGYIQIECTIIPRNTNETSISHPHIPAPRRKGLPLNTVDSTNWSGYAAATNINTPTKDKVTAVYGSWVVPTISSTSVKNNDCAIWVGIDGYSNSTVEQIGTDHSYSGGKQQHYAWFEMYPGGSYLISGFPLNPGDVISASVVYSGNNVFTMTLSNNTRHVTTVIPASYTTSSRALRSSAEWIVEAPFLNGILPLANFGTITMSSCTATINGITDPIGNTSWKNTGIEMVTNTGAAKAIPSALLSGNESFTVTWKHQ